MYIFGIEGLMLLLLLFRYEGATAMSLRCLWDWECIRIKYSFRLHLANKSALDFQSTASMAALLSLPLHHSFKYLIQNPNHIWLPLSKIGVVFDFTVDSRRVPLSLVWSDIFFLPFE